MVKRFVMSVPRIMLLLISIGLVVCGGYFISQAINEDMIGYCPFIGGAALFGEVNLSQQQNG
jgi:hypothetical protein